MKPLVLLDVDGVICNFTKLYVRAAKKARVLPTDFDEEWHPDEWDIGNALNLTVDGKAEVHRVLSRSGAGLLGLEAYEGAIAGVKKIMLVADVYFPTASFTESPTWEYDRRQWFKEHISEEASRRLIFTACKHIIDGNVLVDDKVENVVAWTNAHGYPAILWPHTYNENVPSNVFRAPRRDWDWLYEMVTRGL